MPTQLDGLRVPVDDMIVVKDQHALDLDVKRAGDNTGRAL